MKNIYLHRKIKCFYWAVMLAASVVLFGCPNKVTVKPETHTVAFNIAGNTGGKLTATVDGNNFTGGEVEQGKTVVFTAKPDATYEVNDWTGAVADKDNKTIATLTVDADKTVTVKFKKIENPPHIVPNGKEYDVGGVKFTMYTVPGINFKTIQFAEIPTNNDANWNKVQINITKNGFRLPTEAEWEWAAKGGAENNKWAGTNNESELCDYAWFKDNSGNKTHEVKKKKPNGYGLYDMNGNVKEWCSDWYVKDKPAFGNDPITSTITGRPLKPNRGGSWGYESNKTVQAYRKLYDTSNGPYSALNALGLRLVCRDN